MAVSSPAECNLRRLAHQLLGDGLKDPSMTRDTDAASPDGLIKLRE
jgi:hypothetical protein